MKKLIILTTLALMGMLTGAMAQCGTIVTPQNEQRMGEYAGQIADFERNWTRGFRDIPVKFHIIRTDGGSNGISPNILDKQLEILNGIFIDANIRFIAYEAPAYIDNTYYAEFTNGKAIEKELAAKYETPNVMNVFCMPELGPYCGYAYLPGSSNHRIMMANSCMSNGSTFVHEVGHFFGLYHTHGTSNYGTTDEYVSRSLDMDYDGKPDCLTTGDQCCDTPADPNLGKYNDFCESSCGLNPYFTLTDSRGDPYRPMVENLMSYNPNKRCRNKLTPDQLARIAIVANAEHAKFKMPKSAPIVQTGTPVSGSVKFFMANGAAMPVTADGNLYRFNDSYHSGDSFSFSATNAADVPLNMYIINMGPTGHILKVFPMPYENPNINAGSNYKLGGYISLDNKLGKDYVSLLFTKKTLDIDTVVRKMEDATGTFTQRLYHVLGDELLPVEKVTYREGSSINFNGRIEEDEILPIMLEMDRT